MDNECGFLDFCSGFCANFLNESEVPINEKIRNKKERRKERTKEKKKEKIKNKKGNVNQNFSPYIFLATFRFRFALRAQTHVYAKNISPPFLCKKIFIFNLFVDSKKLF